MSNIIKAANLPGWANVLIASDDVCFHAIDNTQGEACPGIQGLKRAILEAAKRIPRIWSMKWMFYLDQ